MYFQLQEFAEKIVAETHEYWQKLMSNETKNDGLAW
jgi:hypothetical protein